MDRELFDRIDKVTAEEDEGDFQRLAYCTEELGELAIALRVEHGLKRKKLKEGALAEAVDLAITAISMATQLGTYEETMAILEDKMRKWETKQASHELEFAK